MDNTSSESSLRRLRDPVSIALSSCKYQRVYGGSSIPAFALSSSELSLRELRGIQYLALSWLLIQILDLRYFPKGKSEDDKRGWISHKPLPDFGRWREEGAEIWVDDRGSIVILRNPPLSCHPPKFGELTGDPVFPHLHCHSPNSHGELRGIQYLALPWV